MPRPCAIGAWGLIVTADPRIEAAVEAVQATLDRAHVNLWQVDNRYDLPTTETMQFGDVLAVDLRHLIAEALAAVPVPAPQCNGICLDSSEVGVPGYGIAYAHPDCPLHNPEPGFVPR